MMTTMPSLKDLVSLSRTLEVQLVLAKAKGDDERIEEILEKQRTVLAEIAKQTGSSPRLPYTEDS